MQATILEHGRDKGRFKRREMMGSNDICDSVTQADCRLLRARPGQLEMAMEFIDQARELLRKQGIDQWQDGYPEKADIERDISLGRGWFLTYGQTEMAYLCIDFEGEPAYDSLDGTWLKPGASYGVVHRLAINAAWHGKGVAEAALKAAGELMRKEGMQSFRIDTDECNGGMRHLLAKLEFSQRGNIRFQNSVKMAYEKLLA